MSLRSVGLREPGKTVLLSGNEACARGAIEAGVKFCSSYPGSPSSEVLGTLAAMAPEFGFYAEWSTNEKVALESAAAASFAGLRAMSVMKSNGVNVVSDFMASVALSSTGAGLVLLISDDPSSHSSINEQDSRLYSKMFEIPMLEPSDYQEAKDMMKWAFELSETLKQIVIVREVTRIAHARGTVVLGEIPETNARPKFGPNDRYLCLPVFHSRQHQQLAQAAEIFETSTFNKYTGPAGAGDLVICSGTSGMYAREALDALGLEGKIGCLKIGTTYPLPNQLILKHLAQAKRVIFFEEINSFLEDQVMTLAAQNWAKLSNPRFFGQNSGDVAGQKGPGIGEMDPDVVANSLRKILGLPAPSYTPPAALSTGFDAAPKPGGALAGSGAEISGAAGGATPGGCPCPVEPPNRDLAMCSGCPHRASYWALKTALEMDGRGGFVIGDIGCYSMGAMKTGYFTLRTLHSMGSGVGIASGFGKLDFFGFDQPVVAVMGDSTFFHSCVPGLLNARYNRSSFLCVVLDNSTTAMTGHQPHPGTGKNAFGEPVPPVAIEEVTRGIGLPTTVCNPFEVEKTIETVLDLLSQKGLQVLILREPCALVVASSRKKDRVWVEQEECRGEGCGCARFCNRVWACPANIWDSGTNKAAIDDVICTRCGVCVSLCPAGAIKIERAVV